MSRWRRRGTLCRSGRRRRGSDWDEIAASYGVAPGLTDVQVVRRAEPVEQAATHFRIEQIGPQHADSWVRLQVDVYQMDDEGFRAMLAAYDPVGPAGSLPSATCTVRQPGCDRSPQDARLIKLD
ncbi:hypothetical protein GCM10009554_27080 [Kribbella koreensis]|uniref:Uncharacterized protein n=1 Tax=Kribbella koreensis TaxID=57909 RepID=A0ABP4AL31_9ACTN